MGALRTWGGEKNRSSYSIGKSVILEHKKGDSLFSKAGVISAPTENIESPLDELSITGDILSVKDRKTKAKGRRHDTRRKKVESEGKDKCKFVCEHAKKRYQLRCRRMLLPAATLASLFYLMLIYQMTTIASRSYGGNGKARE